MGGITAEEMLGIEDDRGLPRIELMENAGRAAAGLISGKIGLDGRKVLVVCYHGDNGGDGFVAARYLADLCEVDVLFIGDEERFSREAKVDYDRLGQRYEVQVFKDPDIDFDEYDVIVDALLGTGFKGRIREPIASVIKRINKAKAYKVSLDVPSGLDADKGTGALSVKPDLIIAFHATKKGLERFSDITEVADIGIGCRHCKENE